MMKSNNQELWVPIIDYETDYRVSNMGNVFSIKRNKPLRVRKGTKGYGLVNLSKDGKMRTFRVHRLVAIHFIPNLHNLPEINHKNEDKLDNKVTNLEWCDRAYNVRYGDRTNKQKIKLSKPVLQVSIQSNKPIGRYSSTVHAQKETGVCCSSISACCLGKRKTAGGFKWFYQEAVYE